MSKAAQSCPHVNKDGTNKRACACRREHNMGGKSGGVVTKADVWIGCRLSKVDQKRHLLRLDKKLK